MELKKGNKFYIGMHTEEINHTDSKGIPQGLWRDYYAKDQVAFEKYYVDGLRYGPWRYWNSDGKLMQQSYYINNIQEGENLIYGY